MIFCLAPLPPALGYPEGAFLSGGTDHLAKMWTVTGGAVRNGKLAGHANHVNSVAIAGNGDILTGSYDSTAKIWRRDAVVATLEGHKYGVEVCALSTGQIVTGTYKDLRIWASDW